MGTTVEMTDAEYMEYKRKIEADPMAAYREPGLYQLAPEEINEKYDLAAFLMVWITETQRHHIKLEVKHTGWIQELINYEPRRGRPPAGNGMFWNSFLDVVEFKKSKEYTDWLDFVTRYAADNLGKDAKEQPLVSRLLDYCKKAASKAKGKKTRNVSKKVA